MIGRFANLGVYRELLHSRDFYRVAVAGALALASYVWDDTAEPSSTVGVAFALGSVALNGLPIIWGALKGLWQRRVNVDELVALAILASLLRGEFLTAAVVSLVMVLGALIEAATSDSARRAIAALVNVAPERATVLRDGRALEIPIREVGVGDRVLVKPGERIAVDGVIAKGTSAVDESSMTGEPIPVEKTIGAPVFAGTLNQNGVIEVSATKVGEDTTLGKVIKLVSEAEQSRPQTIRLMDRYARWFTPMILVAAAVAGLLSGSIDRAIAVLIVGCPCALILAGPTAVVATIGRAARAGVLVKGGAHLETIGRASAILLDKTGTLTSGKPRVDEIAFGDGENAESVLARAASVEQHSTHPLARAILDAAREAGVQPSTAEEMTTEIGLGVRARVGAAWVRVGSASFVGGAAGLPPPLRDSLGRIQERGATPLVVCEDERALGVIGVADQPRPEARPAIDRLRGHSLRVGMVSGDHEQAARRICRAVGLTECWAGLRPEEKPEVVRALQREGHRVVFVGDGINDAPALAFADVGIAMGAAGTDVALETAHVALMHDDLSKIPLLVELGRRMLRVIKWNIAFGMAFNALAVLASGGGYLTPIMGAIAHNVGSVLVVVSSATMAMVRER